MQRRLIGIATGEIKRLLVGEEGSRPQVHTGKNNSHSRDEGNTAFIILAKTKPNTKLYVISWKGGEQTFFSLNAVHT